MIKSGYSFRVACGHLPDVVSRIVQIGWKTAPLADANSTFGFTKFTKLCKANDLRPVYGVQLSVVVKLGERKPISDRWTFLAIKELRPLHDLIGTATSNGSDPQLTYAQALSAEGVIKISGERIQLDETNKLCDGHNFYIGLSPATPKGLFSEAKKFGYKFCALSDNVYPRAEDQEFYRVTLGKRSQNQTYPQHILDDDEWRESVKYIADKDSREFALLQREEILQQCTATMKKATLLIPAKPKTLRTMCVEGAKRLGVNLKDKVYKERLERELAVIAHMKNEDYFYILTDIMSFARKNMICGPGRGSSCGSLVVFLLGITTVDPIKFDLLFERFLDETRTDSLPDIDLDMDDEDRHFVFEYLETKYGKDHIAKLGTVGVFGAKSAMNQICTALQLPRWKGDEALVGLIHRNDGDARYQNTLQDTLETTEQGRKFLAENPSASVAYPMEGHPSYAGTHAAGLVLTQNPILDIMAVDARSKTTMCDMKDAEELGMLKIDALGLTQLSIFKRALELIHAV